MVINKLLLPKSVCDFLFIGGSGTTKHSCCYANVWLEKLLFFNDKQQLFDVVSYMTCCIEEAQQIVECYQTVE